MEKAFYFGSPNNELFGILHIPDQLENSKGQNCIIFCAPFAEEKLWCHRLFVYLARELCKAGFVVFRFDYFGHGDSAGEFENTTVQTRLNNINTAISQVKNNFNAVTIGLLGIRLGASLATMCSQNNSDVNYLILLEPIIQGNNYMQRCLRSNLATQLLIHGEVQKTRDDLVNDLNAGTPVNIDGYLLSKELYQQIQQIDLLEKIKLVNLPVLLLNLRKSKSSKFTPDIELFWAEIEKKEVTKRFDIIVSGYVWGEMKNYIQINEDLKDSILNWLQVDLYTKNERGE